MPVHKALVVVALAAVLGGCGGSSPSPQPLSAKLVPVQGSSIPDVVLTQLGAERIGIRIAPTAAVARRRGHRPMAVIPYSAVLYLLDGTSVVYTSPVPLTYTQVPISIDHISGDDVFIDRGPPPGTSVVAVGGEELLGVQEGVEAES
jgi:hypothetical protein